MWFNYLFVISEQAHWCPLCRRTGFQGKTIRPSLFTGLDPVIQCPHRLLGQSKSAPKVYSGDRTPETTQYIAPELDHRVKPGEEQKG